MTTTRNILLIDDDPDIHSAVKLILEPEGYQVQCALTGAAGMELARKSRPDAILLDVMLTSPSEGFHLAYEMRQDESLSGVPIVILSAIGRTMGMDYAKELGTDYLPANAFVEKPFDAATLREAVRSVLT